MKKAIIWALAFGALISVASAQTPLPSSTASDLTADWQMLIGSANHVGRSIAGVLKENADLKAENAKLKKELEDMKKPPSAAPKK